MPKSKQSFATKRVGRFIRKNIPEIQAKRLNARLDEMATQLEWWLLILDNLEKDTLAVLQANNIPAEQVEFYFAYAKKQLNRVKKFDFETLFKELWINIETFIKRQLSEQKLIEIRDMIKQNFQGVLSTYPALFDITDFDWCSFWL
ncbi:MAG: hypothetical protein QW423_03465 [Candidatus Aenigmatarchaeota archaeon]